MGHRCLNTNWLCDGQVDCADHTDEMDCSPMVEPINIEEEPCPNGEFRCDEFTCIPESFLCDLDNDCMDGTDETTEACGMW